MQKINKILSRVLLATYLLAVLHHSMNHRHAGESCDFFHQHDCYEEVHHEHNFHGGIFHFLGHLLEDISHAETLEKDYVCSSVVYKAVTQKKLGSSDFYVGLNLFTYRLIPENRFSNQYFYPSFLLRLSQQGNPLRAPPFLI